MRLKKLSFLFLLLVVSAWLDDAWVTARTDDSPAVQDNEYLHTPSTSRPPTARALPRSPAGRARPGQVGLADCPARCLSREARSAAHFAVPLLYLLMSLQR